MSGQNFDNRGAYEAYLQEHWFDNVNTLLARHGVEYFDKIAQGFTVLFSTDRAYLAPFDLELKSAATISDFHAGAFLGSLGFMAATPRKRKSIA